ncbi:MAG: hypothetical protein K1X75_08150 [Leptospirales bacterium]|nr:hypothetical protein [Leptospirales bacterium]
MSAGMSIKARVAAADGFFYVFGLLLHPGGKAITEVCAVAGDASDFAAVDLNLGFREMTAWTKTMVFGGQADAQRTQDIQRYVGVHFKNIEWVERLVQRLQNGDLGGLQYELGAELEVALGQHNVVIQIAASEENDEKAAAPAEAKTKSAGPSGPVEDLSGHMRGLFVISPFMGQPVQRLGIGDRVRLRFAEMKHPQVVSYVQMQGLDKLEGPPEITASVRTISTVRGSGEMLVTFDLPGGHKAYVREENLNLKVKLAEGAKSQGRSASMIDRSIFGWPLFVMLAIVGIAGIAGILYLFLF